MVIVYQICFIIL